MSRNTSHTMAAAAPAALRPSTLRTGLALAVAAAMGAFAMRLNAQAPSQTALQVRPLVGALVATGDQRDVLNNAVLVGGQASYTLNENFGLVGSFAWSPSDSRRSTPPGCRS